MDWGVVSTIILGLIGIVGSIIGFVLTKQSKDANRIQKLEAENRTLELKNISKSIERVHSRIDDVEETQKEISNKLNDGENGIFVRLAKLETRLSEDAS